MNYEVQVLDDEVYDLETSTGVPLNEAEYFYYVGQYLQAYFNELGTE